MSHVFRSGFRIESHNDKNIWVIDNTKPFVRVGRKAYRVSVRQPGRRNTRKVLGAWLFLLIREFTDHCVKYYPVTNNGQTRSAAYNLNGGSTVAPTLVAPANLKVN